MALRFMMSESFDVVLVGSEPKGMSTMLSMPRNWSASPRFWEMAFVWRVVVPTTVRGMETTNSDLTPAVPLLSITTFWLSSPMSSEEQAVKPVVHVTARAIRAVN